MAKTSTQWQLEVCKALRSFQNKTSCSTRHLQRMLETFSPFLAKEAPASVKKADKVLQDAAGAKYEILNGCVGHNCEHVYGPLDGATHCPSCNTARYKENGAPKEIVFYFPLKKRLEALMRTARYRHLLTYEHRRKKNDEYYSDVYDSPGLCLVQNDACIVSMTVNCLFIM